MALPEKRVMDIAKIIAELRSERERLDGIIIALERLGAEGQLPMGPKRRGRKFMDKAGRQEVSERMKRYWAARRGEHDGSNGSATSVAVHAQTSSDSNSVS